MLSETATTTVSPTTTSDVKPKTDAIANVPSREDIISDVDSIMTQLDQLSAQVKEDFNIEILDESLVLEGAWDDTKDNFGSLFGDPVFQLVGLGIAGIIGALGLSVKAVKDTKRNGAIGKMVMGDYAKLKQLKLQEVKLEAIQHQLEEKKDDIEAANESVINEANPVAKKPAQKPQAGPNAQARQTAIADKEKALKAKEAEAKKNAAAANKTTSSDENDARDKMAEKIEAQIQAIIKKRDVLDTSITTYESTLDAKYTEEKITGFGSKKVHTLIASAKDGVAQEVAEARLKFFSETLSDEALKELKESLDAINQRQAKRTADINKEAEENAAKAKEVAAEDEDVKAALDKIKNPNANDDEEEPETEEEPTSDDGDGDSDAVKALKKQKEEDDEKKRQERAANKEDDTKNAEKETTKNTKDGKLDRVEDMIKKETEKVQNNPEAKKIKDKITEIEGAIEELTSKKNKSKDDDKTIENLKNQLNTENKRLDKVSSSDKLQKLKDLKDQIAAKENWQLEGTELGRLFEMEISKLEKEYMINESSSLSISDKFKLLMG
jgi:DNA repair exonuclease SbcCD ATPase subunit